MSTGFNIGPLTVRYYGLILVSGVIAAAFLAEKIAKRKGKDPNTVWDALFFLLIGGIIGARLWHVFTPPPSMIEMGYTTKYYLTHPVAILQTWKGGLGIPGAVIGGMIALYFYTKRKGFSFAEWADIGAPTVALAQAIGRWGNFINQELYGAPTDLPWAIKIDPLYRVPGYENFTHFHPLFLYESIWNLANMFFLLFIGRKYEAKLRPGDVILTYLITYPVGRFFLEFLRLDSPQFGQLNTNQTIMGLVAIAAGITLFVRHRTKPKMKQKRSR